jgi:hypothetical protein
VRTVWHSWKGTRERTNGDVLSGLDGTDGDTVTSGAGVADEVDVRSIVDLRKRSRNG